MIQRPNERSLKPLWLIDLPSNPDFTKSGNIWTSSFNSSVVQMVNVKPAAMAQMLDSISNLVDLTTFIFILLII